MTHCCPSDIIAPINDVQISLPTPLQCVDDSRLWEVCPALDHYRHFQRASSDNPLDVNHLGQGHWCVLGAEKHPKTSHCNRRQQHWKLGSRVTPRSHQWRDLVCARLWWSRDSYNVKAHLCECAEGKFTVRNHAYLTRRSTLIKKWVGSLTHCFGSEVGNVTVLRECSVQHL